MMEKQDKTLITSIIVFICVFMLILLSVKDCKGDIVNSDGNNESTVVTETEAKIISEDYAKDVVKSPDDLEILDYSCEKYDNDVFHVVLSVKTMNGIGNMVPAKISVRLKYMSGEWEDVNNWQLISIKMLNEATGNIE